MSLSNRVLKEVIVHLSLWFFFIIVPLLSILPLIVDNSAVQFHYILVTSLASGVLMIGIFYLNYLYLFPKFFLRRKRFQYVLGILLALGVSILIIRITRVSLQDFVNERPVEQSIYFFGYGIFRLVLVVFVSGSLVVYERLQTALKDRLQAENSFLRAQINPHFLFNTLNGIYSMIVQNQDGAAKSVERLSSIMRFVTNEVEKDRINLEKEVEYINNYIELQRFRLTEKVTIEYSAKGDFSSAQIIPFVLISFVENAFKYGVSTELDCVIELEIELSGNLFSFKLANDKIGREIETSSDGIGLKNTMQRLSTAYGARYSLHIDDSEDRYAVNLTIDLE
jgi:hypothetical protein